jgi:hypothetical protein
MTPKEKADEIFEKMLNKVYLLDKMPWRDVSKKCTLIAVDEILWEIIKYADNSKEYVTENTNYWEEVKQEIELL